MPCLEVTMPAVSLTVKTDIAKKLSEAFAGATGHDKNIFGIKFNEYNAFEASNGGVLWDGQNGVPYLHFVLYTPRLKRSAKQKFVSAATEAFVTAIEKPDWQPAIHICEHPYDNVGVGGKLLTDAYEELKKREFYFPLPND